MAAYQSGAGKGLCAEVMGIAMKMRDEELLGFPWLGEGKKPSEMDCTLF